jgi:hypothetical protein
MSGIAAGVPIHRTRDKKLKERLTTTKEMGEMNGIVGYLDERAAGIRNWTWPNAKMTNRCVVQGQHQAPNMMQFVFRRTMTRVGIWALAAKREALVVVRASNPAQPIQLPRLFHSCIPMRPRNPWRGLCLGLDNRHAAVNRQLKPSCVCRKPLHSACAPHFFEALGSCVSCYPSMIANDARTTVR